MNGEVELFGYSYARNTACIICRHLAEGAALQAVAHDPDGDIMFACGKDGHPDEEWKVIGLGRAADMLDLTSVPSLEEGQIARRRASDDEWQVGPLA